MERLEGESFEDYKERRKQHNKEIKKKLKPKMFWPSRQGTYIRPKKSSTSNT